MDFEENIKRKADDLIRKAKVLPNISIVWENPIQLKCNELTTAEALRAKNVFTPLVLADIL